MPRRAERARLARLYTRWLALLFIVLELVTVAAALGFIFLPMSRRAADDLAGLMVLSAQTWAELPPATRPLFEAELRRSHELALRPQMAPVADEGLRHGWYLGFLEDALQRRVGHELFFRRERSEDGADWLWVAIPTAGSSIGVGFARSRMQANPIGALAVALPIGALLVALLAWWLASRIAKPVARLELAAAQLARGDNPALLNEEGPRELADLARHFNHMALQLRELSDARTTLFAGLSHDLRTPLARMRLALEMLRLKPDPKLLERLDSDIEEMNALIGQLLEIARGLSKERHETLELCEWLRQRMADHAPLAASAGAALQLHCEQALRLSAPPRMLGRVLDNLLGNALRYAPGPIELVGTRCDAGVRIGVLDRGPGIPGAELETVFRPFQRVEGRLGAAQGGFGLGLAIVQQLAHANGWRVSLEPREGGGLAAWVELPAPV